MIRDMETWGTIVALQGARMLGDMMVQMMKVKEGRKSTDTKKVVEELVEEWLSFFQAYIRDHIHIDDKGISLMSQDLLSKIQDITFNIQDALDEFMYDIPHHIHTTQFRKVMHDVAHSPQRALRKLRSTAQEIKERINAQREIVEFRRKIAKENETTFIERPLSHDIVKEDKLVGFDQQRQSLLNHLITNSRDDHDGMKRATVSVVGPGGSGKTFLVKSVYVEKQIDDCFDCHAWISVSPSFQMKSLSLQMRRQFFLAKSNNDIQAQLMDDNDFDQDHHHRPLLTRTEFQLLEKKRYLLVLDDVWSNHVYVRLANALPNGCNGSRIIVTSRKNDIAGADPSNYIQMLGVGLNEEEAWNLLCSKIFGGSNVASSEKMWLSEKLLNRCEGLPLAIAAVGSRLPTEQLEWQSFYNSLANELRPVTESILHPSIFDLPENIRSCFLYWSAFPEGDSIKRGRLIRSWIAEGFVEKIQGLTPEEVAETYLNGLVNRNLLMVSEREIGGRVKSCRVLKLLHQHLVSMSKKGSFLSTIAKSNEYSGERVRRLSVRHDAVFDSIQIIKDNDLWQVRTLFVFPKQHTPDLSSLSRSSSSSSRSRSSSIKRDNNYLLQSIPHKFKLLKVLDLQDTPLQELSEDIGRLVLLRCLNLRGTNIHSVPSSIKKLVFLETLNMKHTLVRCLPKGISKLRRLRHLLASCVEGKEQGVEVSALDISSLVSLQELSLVNVSNAKQIIQDLENLIELKKLRLVGLGKESEIELCRSIEKMKTLTKLEVRARAEEVIDLNLDMKEPPQIQCLCLKGRLKLLPGWISKLQSLIKLSLKGSNLSSNEKPIEAFEDLPNLMELEMVDCYRGRTLVFKAGMFRKLKIVRIEEFPELAELVLENYTMPNLQKLTISKCYKLKSVPELVTTADSEPLVEMYDCDQQ